MESAFNKAISMIFHHFADLVKVFDIKDASNAREVPEATL